MTKEEADLIIAEQNKSKEEILKAVAKVKADYHELCKLKDMRIAELEKENAELKCECRRCVYTDSPCILSDYGKDKNGMCDHFKDVFDENAELTDKVKELEAEVNRLKLNEQLAVNNGKNLLKENTELRKEWQEQVQKATDEGFARTLQTIQLSKAKEIMNIAIEGIKHWGVVGGTERPFEKQAEKLFNLFLDKAEQFIKENE